MKKEKVFYGWYVVVGIILLMACNYGIINNCASLFFKPVSESIGVSRTQFSMYYSIAGITAMVLCPFVGRVMSKVGLKKTMLIAAIIGSIGIAGFSVSNSLRAFYILGAMQGIGLIFLTNVPAAIIINKWFIKNKGTALGIAMLGGGLGGLILSPIINYLIYNVGWRQTYLILGIICFVITALVVIFIMEDCPERKGLLAYGYDGTSIDKNNNKHVVKEKENIFNKPVFWIICICTLVYTIGNVGVQLHIPSYLTDISFSTTFAAFVVTITLASAIPSKIIIGYVIDKLGLTVGILSGGVIMLCCQLVLKNVSSEISAIVFGVLFGYGTCLLIIGAPLIVSKLFNDEAYETAVGIVTLFMTLGTVIGPMVSSSIYDSTGSYDIAWSIFIVLTIVSIVALASITFKNSRGNKVELSTTKSINK